MRNPIFAKRVETIQVSAIKQMPLAARAVSGAISLGQGIPSLPTPLAIRERVIELLKTEDEIGKYSLQPGLPALKEAVANRLSKTAGTPVDAEREIFISGGAMEALFCAMVSLIEPGDEVILFDPSYASHIEQVLFAGGTPVFVPLQEEAGWAPCITTLKRAVTAKTKAIVVCSPGNPTGKVFSRQDLSQIAELAAAEDLWVIADETYDFLVYDEKPFVSLSSFSAIRDRLVSCFSFSKQFAMTGWRVGYMYAPAPVIEQALKVHDATLICAPTISQYAALAALSLGTSEESKAMNRTLAARRELLCSRLLELDDLFSFVKPEGAYYVLPRYRKTTLQSQDMAMKILHEAKVITIPGRAFGPSGESHIRLSYGGTEEQIEEAMRRLAEWNRKI